MLRWNTADLLLPCAVRILWKKNEVADYEATTFSIFYNNTLFLVLVIVASFFLLKNFNPTVYPFSQTHLVELWEALGSVCWSPPLLFCQSFIFSLTFLQ